ncbi:hypothetical protein ACP70R_013925 [Stipagrostis hirtigluma subsp. patula]
MCSGAARHGGVRCVCKAWRAVVDARGLLLRHAVRDIFLNYMGYPRARFFSRPSSAFPQVSGDLGLALGDGPCYGISLAFGKYQVIKMPVDIKDECARSYLGRSVGGVYFAATQGFRLRVWVLNESSGQIEWMLKHDGNLERSALWAAVRTSRHHQTVGPWILSYVKKGENSNSSMLQEEHLEWDSDDDGTLHYEDGDEQYTKLIYFLGFRPYKE